MTAPTSLLPRLCGDVLTALAKRRGGATCDELEAATGLRHQTCSPRLTELRRMGLIREGGARKTRSGRWATVWRRAP